MGSCVLMRCANLSISSFLMVLCACVFECSGQKLMPTCLIEFLTAKPEEQKEKEKQLYDELKGINDYLEKNGPYFGGQNVTTHDLVG